MQDKQLIHWQIIMAVSLLIPSALIFALQIHIFGNPRDTFFYLLQDLAFVPVQVLIVTVLINQLMAFREKRNMVKRLNMMIGVYFSDTGNQLVRLLMTFDGNLSDLREELLVNAQWGKRDFLEARRIVEEHRAKINSRDGDLGHLRGFLLSRRPFLLSLFENPNLQEHQSFTDALWTIFHLTDELAEREHIEELPEADLQHLGVDIQRAYRPLVLQWLLYMEHLQEEYPFLFSLAERKNPFKHVQNVIFE